MTSLRHAAGSERLKAPAISLATWCGWVLTGVAALTPLLAWLGPLGFALLMGLAGLLCLPAVRIPLRDAPLAILLLSGLAWVAASSFWSPYHPRDAGGSSPLKLALQLPLYWAVWQGARRADTAGRRRALRVFAWGLALLGLVLLVEAFTGGAIYAALRSAIGDPIRPDLGRKNLAQASFVLALLWPVATAGGLRTGAPVWLAAPMAAGTAVLAQLFLSDAPTLAVGLAILVGAAVWAWPRSAPKALGLAAALVVVFTPLLVLGVRASGLADGLPTSWAQRMGYWTFAVERISERPWTGWGVDASRTFSPHIQLHPHNGPLQLWLELGVVGAALAALILALIFRRTSPGTRSLLACGCAASAAVYVLFGSVSFGVWQEWWLALGALTASFAALAAGAVESRPGAHIDAA